MTTAKAIQTPEPDTKPDSEPIAGQKADKPAEKPSVQTANFILSLVTICSVLVAGVSGYTVIAVRADRTEQRSIETAAKVEKLAEVASEVKTMKVEFGYMKSSVESFDKKLDRILEAKK